MVVDARLRSRHPSKARPPHRRPTAQRAESPSSPPHLRRPRNLDRCGPMQHPATLIAFLVACGVRRCGPRSSAPQRTPCVPRIWGARRGYLTDKAGRPRRRGPQTRIEGELAQQSRRRCRCSSRSSRWPDVAPGTIEEFRRPGSSNAGASGGCREGRKGLLLVVAVAERGTCVFEVGYGFGGGRSPMAASAASSANTSCPRFRGRRLMPAAIKRRALAAAAGFRRGIERVCRHRLPVPAAPRQRVPRQEALSRRRFSFSSSSPSSFLGFVCRVARGVGRRSRLRRAPWVWWPLRGRRLRRRAAFGGGLWRLRWRRPRVAVGRDGTLVGPSGSLQEEEKIQCARASSRLIGGRSHCWDFWHCAWWASYNGPRHPSRRKVRTAWAEVEQTCLLRRKRTLHPESGRDGEGLRGAQEARPCSANIARRARRRLGRGRAHPPRERNRGRPRPWDTALGAPARRPFEELTRKAALERETSCACRTSSPGQPRNRLSVGPYALQRGSVGAFSNAKHSGVFPTTLFAGMFGFAAEPFLTPWRRKAKEVPKVDFRIGSLARQSRDVLETRITRQGGVRG